MTARKHYTKEMPSVSGIGSATEVSRNLETNVSMLRRWMRESQRDDAGQAFHGNGKLTPGQEEIRKLKTHIRPM